MSKKSILKLTLVFHALLALVVAVDAKRHGRSVGTWVAVTLLTGLVGVLVYVVSGGDNDVPLDELVDQVELE
jgi:lipopolysaccharide export LptBFGC system permease protein LptF